MINNNYLRWRLSFFLMLVSVHHLLIPFSTVNRTYSTPFGRISYADVYIFGVRIARIQLT
jgi:hypothetical protein